MPKYSQYAPDPQSDEPPNANDRYDFRQWVADPTDDAPGIVRRHVAILVAEKGLSKTQAWKVAMADVRLTRPVPRTSGVHKGSDSFYTHRFTCECGYEQDSYDLAGAKRGRDAHARFHTEQRQTDRALLDEMREVVR